MYLSRNWLCPRYCTRALSQRFATVRPVSVLPLMALHHSPDPATVCNSDGPPVARRPCRALNLYHGLTAARACHTAGKAASEPAGPCPAPSGTYGPIRRLRGLSGPSGIPPLTRASRRLLQPHTDAQATPQPCLGTARGIGGHSPGKAPSRDPAHDPEKVPKAKPENR